MSRMLAPLLSGLLLFGAASSTSGEPPERIRLQGTLSQLAGSAVEDGQYDFEVSLYEQATGGDPLLTMAASAPVAGGAYSLLVNPASPGALRQVVDSARYVEIRIVAGPNGPIDEVLTPRQPLASVPHALNATDGGCADRGRLRYLSATTVRLEPLAGSRVCVQIQGQPVRLGAGEVVLFDLASDLESGSPQPETFYYLYVSNEGGSLAGQISATPPISPVTDPDSGHHPAQNSWRFVQAIALDDSAEVWPFSEDRSGRITLSYWPLNQWPQRCGGGGCPSGTSIPKDLPISRNYQAIDLDAYAPEGARDVLVQTGSNGSVYLGIVGGEAVPLALGRDASTLATAYREWRSGVWETTLEWIPIGPQDRIALGFGKGSAVTLDRYRLTTLGWAY